MRLAVAILTLLLAASTFAQTHPPPAKRLPPAGIAISAADRAELAAGAAALGKEIDALRRAIPTNDDRALALLPDVEIFHKAVDWALRYDEFFDAKQVAYARHLLAEGHTRAQHFHDSPQPWLVATGIVLHGYRSKLDDSVQPYVVVVPPAWRPEEKQKRRLDVVLSGRNEKRTELAFFAEREKSPGDIVPADALVLYPYGRFCNATKFAGEVDVFEAMDAVGRNYGYDPTRVVDRGFSMGGASAWHLAAHHAGLWVAASPGAGFAETAIYTKALAPGKTPPPWWEQTLWHWYNATDVAGNLFNCPTVAYSGEIDPQKQSADLMEQAMATEGLKLERFIGPQTGHKYEPATKAKLAARLDELAAHGQEAWPGEIRLATYTPRYPGDRWVSILALSKQWERADVRVRTLNPNTVTIETKNVRELELRNSPTEITIDGQKLPSHQTSRSGRALWKENGNWHYAAETPRSDLYKHTALSGPIDDAFMDAFVFVRPTNRPLNEKIGAWTDREFTHATKMWRDLFRGEAPVKSDADVTDADIANHNLVLWGDPSSNKLLARILAQLPLQWTADKLVFRGQTYDATHTAPILIFPNPLNPAHYIVLNSGMDFRDDAYGSNALQTPKLPDYAIVDLDTPPGPKWPGKIVDAGFFDEDWK